MVGRGSRCGDISYGRIYFVETDIPAEQMGNITADDYLKAKDEDRALTDQSEEVLIRALKLWNADETLRKPIAKLLGGKTWKTTWEKLGRDKKNADLVKKIQQQM